MPASVLQTDGLNTARIHNEVEDELLLATIDAAETVRSDDLNQSEQLANTGLRVEEEAAEARVVPEHTEPPSEIPTEESAHLRDEDLMQFQGVLEGGLTAHDAAIDQGEPPLTVDDNADNTDNDELDCKI